MTPATTKPAPAAPPHPAATIGDQIRSSPAVTKAIDQIASDIRSRSAAITDVRPANPALAQTYEALLKEVTELRGRPLYYPYLGSGAGNGALVELMDGSVKWDMISGIGVHFFGHGDDGLTRAALEGALSDTVQNGNLQSDWSQYRFMQSLVRLAKRSSRLRYGFATTSGCMANENAIKVCYQKNQPASRVIAFRDCFMGRSVTMTQIGDTAAYRVGIPLSTQVDYMPFWDAAAARRMGEAEFTKMCVSHLEQYIERYPRQHAAFIFELVQGEGGFNAAPREFFVALMEVCRKHGIAVWDDEIQTFGRTESMFAYDRLGLGELVDVLTVGKMTQACATLWTQEYNPGPGLISGTFTSSAVAFSVGAHVLERLEGGGYYGAEGSNAKHFAAFASQVRSLASRRPEWFPPAVAPYQITDIVGGNGGMMRFTPFGGAKERVIKACTHLYNEGVIAFYCGHGPYHIRLLPPLGVMKEADWPRVFARIE
ncbi:MAG: aminotransferase class III-fold pyridoxal phosphate-dependent enzyme, partial [Gemmataceae bacterium]|nr:aminotransferase class III-fold pyridoxal phosphate-dependent enzyme [Gemmataceae bacterium]